MNMLPMLGFFVVYCLAVLCKKYNKVRCFGALAYVVESVNGR